MQHRIQVGLAYYSVGTCQESESAWAAFAEYAGEMIVVEAETEQGALKKWRDAALKRGRHGPGNLKAQ
jgi:hypothetical protein